MTTDTKNRRGGKRKGAGRKHKYGSPTKPIVVTVPTDMLELLDAGASDAGISRSEFVVRSLSDKMAEPALFKAFVAWKADREETAEMPE